MAAYYHNQEYIGAIKEPTLWNWIWYIGTTTTYALIVASSFAKFSEEEKGVRKLEKKLRKYEMRSLREKMKNILNNRNH